jgi:hypothetical protein
LAGRVRGRTVGTDCTSRGGCCRAPLDGRTAVGFEPPPAPFGVEAAPLLLDDDEDGLLDEDGLEPLLDEGLLDETLGDDERDDEPLEKLPPPPREPPMLAASASGAATSSVVSMARTVLRMAFLLLLDLPQRRHDARV